MKPATSHIPTATPTAIATSRLPMRLPRIFIARCHPE
jgi:hypothetical protein